jgi:hypothetical protein
MTWNRGDIYWAMVISQCCWPSDCCWPVFYLYIWLEYRADIYDTGIVNLRHRSYITSMEEFRRLPLPHRKERFPSWRIGNLRYRDYITSMEEFRTLPLPHRKEMFPSRHLSISFGFSLFVCSPLVYQRNTIIWNPE